MNPSPFAAAAAVLRKRQLRPAESDAVSRLEMQAMHYADQDLIEALTDNMTFTDRRTVLKALAMAHYHSKPDPRPALSKADQATLAALTAAVEAKRKHYEAEQIKLDSLRLALRRVKPDDTETAVAAFRGAEDEVADVRAALERAMGHLSAFHVAQGNHRRAELLAASVKA
jgi:hypothetical protein